MKHKEGDIELIKRKESYKCGDYFRTKLQELHSTNIVFKTISIFLFVSINKKHPDYCNLSHIIMLYNDEYDQKGRMIVLYVIIMLKVCIRNKI